MTIVKIIYIYIHIYKGKEILKGKWKYESLVFQENKKKNLRSNKINIKLTRFSRNVLKIM